MPAKKTVRVAVTAVVLVLGGSWAAYHYTTGRWLESTDNATIRADITTMSSRVGGEVIAVAVGDNQFVKKGEVLLRLDPRDYAVRLANAKAAAAGAEASLLMNTRTQLMQGAMVEQAAAALAAAQAEKSRSKKDYDRADTLVREGVATVARLDTASATYTGADANVAKGAAGLKVARTQVGTMTAEHDKLRAQLAAAEAAVQLAELDLEATTLRAPIDGSVGDLTVKLGERIVPNQRLLSLVNGSEVWAEANFKETQLTRFVVGQAARVKVDAYPDAEIEARIQSLAPASGAEFALLPPDNATGNFTKIVQRVPVKFALTLPPALTGRLKSGMSVEVVVDTRTRSQ